MKLNVLKGISCANCPLSGKDCEQYKIDCKVKFKRDEKADNWGRMVTVFNKGDFVNGHAVLKDGKLYCVSAESDIYPDYTDFVDNQSVYISETYKVYKNDYMMRKVTHNLYKNKVIDFVKELYELLPRELMIYLVGGSLKHIILGQEEKIKDYDLIIINKNHKHPNLEKIFIELDFKFIKNNLGGFKVDYKGITIDIWEDTDFKVSEQYNIDGFYYCLTNHKFWESTSFQNIIEYRKLIEINNSKLNPNKQRNKERKKKCQQLVNDWIEFKEKQNKTL